MSLGWLEDLPRFCFFTGKGGVGKTSLACATAVRLADAGERVLLVSTDPASNVGQVFGQIIGDRITPIEAVPGLEALEIDPEQAAEAYRESVVGPVRGLLPEAEIASITEQLSGSCTTEIASFNEFTSLLADDSRLVGYDRVIFDTAPTGHTIRLLQLPGEWTDFLSKGQGDASCLGPMAGLDKSRTTYADAVRRLADPAQTRLVLVARPQRASLAEVARTSAELRAVGLGNQHLVINGLHPDDRLGDDLLRALRARERAELEALAPPLSDLPHDRIELRAEAVMGMNALRDLLGSRPAEPVLRSPETRRLEGLSSQPTPPVVAATRKPLRQLIDELEAGGPCLVMCMGKGGVGKTTVAAAVAIALADRGHDVTLSTTDPAAHLDAAVGGHVPRLTVSRIDPAEATRTYRDRVLATKGKHLDDVGRAQLAEDLASPCTEEVAVFQQFSKLVNASKRHYVVLDTAPTGHTLLLMDATGSYHRDVVRTMGEGTSYTTPLMRLQDANATRVLIVSLPEPTPVLEAEGLVADLRRAQIEPWAWVVNQSLAAAHPQSPFLRSRAAAETPYVDRVRAQAPRLAVLPLLAEEPVGAARLRALAEAAETHVEAAEEPAEATQPHAEMAEEPAEAAEKHAEAAEETESTGDVQEPTPAGARSSTFERSPHPPRERA